MRISHFSEVKNIWEILYKPVLQFDISPQYQFLQCTHKITETLFSCLKGRGFHFEDTHMIKVESIKNYLFISYCLLLGSKNKSKLNLSNVSQDKALIKEESTHDIENDSELLLASLNLYFDDQALLATSRGRTSSTESDSKNDETSSFYFTEESESDLSYSEMAASYEKKPRGRGPN